MGKQQKLKAQVKATASEVQLAPLTLGGKKLRHFTGLDAAFGARLQDYPPMSSVPVSVKPYEVVASGLFFGGGRLADYGLSIKAGLDRAQVMTAIQALLSSFDPKHEHKTAVVAWALSEWCDGEPTRRIAPSQA